MGKKLLQIAVNAPVNLDEAWETILTIVAKNKGTDTFKTGIIGGFKYCLFVELNGGEYAGEWRFNVIGDALNVLGDNEFIDAINKFKLEDYIISLYDK